MITHYNIRSASDADVSTSCLYHLLAEQSAGDVRNLKPGGSLAVKDASFTDLEAWVNPGYLTTGADNTAFAVLPAAETHFTLVGRSLILILRLKKATPAGTEIFISNTTGGEFPGGITIDARSDAKVRLTVFAADGSNAGISALGDIADGTEKTVMFAVPSAGSSLQAWMNGRLMNTASASNIVGKNCIGNGDLRIGSVLTSNAAKTAQIATLAAYNPAKSLEELPLALLADYAYRNPGMPLERWML